MINRVFLFFTLLLSITLASAFTSSIHRPLKGSSSGRTTPTQLHAAKKAATKSKSKAKEEEEVVNFKKAEFVAAVAEKTGMTKGDSEKALSAVLNVIASVSNGDARV
jgi:predicted lipid-binding transport protein (Tim44 family)